MRKSGRWGVVAGVLALLLSVLSSAAPAASAVPAEPAAGTASLAVTVDPVTGTDDWPWVVLLSKDGVNQWEGFPPTVWTLGQVIDFADLEAGSYDLTVGNYGFGQYTDTYFSTKVVLADGEAAAITATVDDRPTCPSYRVRTADGSALPAALLLKSEQSGEGGTGFRTQETGGAASTTFVGPDPCYTLGGSFIVQVWTTDGFGSGAPPLAGGFVTAQPGTSPTIDLVVGESGGGTVTGNPDARAYPDLLTGEMVVHVWRGSTGGFTLTFPAACPGGATPTAVALQHGGTTVAASAAGAGLFSATLTREQLADGQALQAAVTCPGDGTVVQSVGRVVLYDPSGVITDAGTGEPIVGATVLLYEVEGWSPRSGPDDVEPNRCESNLSKAPEAPWSQLAVWEDATFAESAAATGRVSPANPTQQTDADGRYGWDVSWGCWFVQVEADGWASRTSPMVGIPPEVTDLHVALERIVPDVPAGAQAQAGEASATVFWNEVPENGAPITGYRVTVSPGGAIVDVDGSTFMTVIPGLTPGTPYTFTVAAGNGAGFGAASAPTAAVTPTAPPVVTCDEDAFSDVDATSPFCDEITWMVNEGITKGYDDGTFRPGSGVTRQAIAAWLYRYAGQPDPTGVCDTTGGFSDITPAHPFCHQIMWMVDAGLANGYPDGTFKPTNPISRQAMSAFLFRLDLQVETGDCPGTGFPDVGLTHPFCHEVAWMVANGITNGYQDGTFKPTNTISRQAASAFLYRFDALDAE